MATLAEILSNRDERTIYRTVLIDRFHFPLICFTLNLPGPEKYTAQSSLIHAAGTAVLFASLQFHALQPVHAEIRHQKTGIEGFFVTDASPLFLKKICCQIEEDHPLGRLFDMDVFDPKNTPINRAQAGFPERTCLLCGGNVTVCRREKKHSLTAFNERVMEMIHAYYCSAKNDLLGPTSAERHTDHRP